jgi:hypothetical protein
MVYVPELIYCWTNLGTRIERISRELLLSYSIW